MLRRILSKALYFVRLASSGDAGALWADARRFAWSDAHFLGLSRDLTVPFEHPAARIAFEVRPLDDELAKLVFNSEGLVPLERRELEHRRRIWESGLGRAYVAIDTEGQPCYLEWAIPGAQAQRIESFFGATFPHLAPDEILLEGAWVPPHLRGQRIMSEALSLISVAGAGTQCRRAITFVSIDNEPSLRGCYAAGFQVYCERIDRWRLGRRQVTWRPSRHRSILPRIPSPAENAPS